MQRAARRRQAQPGALLLDARDPGVLENPDSLALRDTGKASGQLRWMNRRGFRGEKRTQGKRAAQPLAGLVAPELLPVVDAESSRCGQGDLDIHCVRFRQGQHELTVARELGVDRLALEEGLHLVEVPAGELGQVARFVFAEVLNGEGVRVVEGLADLAGVPARGAVGDRARLRAGRPPSRARAPSGRAPSKGR